MIVTVIPLASQNTVIVTLTDITLQEVWSIIILTVYIYIYIYIYM